MTTPQLLQGIFAPTLTPLHADLSPDVDRWIQFCQRLLAEGCHGLCPFGTTSEANSFSVDERIDMLDRLIEAGVDPGVLMPGTGCCALTDTVKLTAHAVDRGCGGVLMLPPFYYKGVSDEGIFRSFAEVIERVGDDRLRVYLYHIPPQAVVGFSLPLIERLLKAYPGIVVGMKDSSGDWSNMEAVMSAFPGFGFFTGSEKFLLATLRKGGVGSINAVANLSAGIQRRLYDNWQTAGADAMQEEINGMRTLLQGVPVIPALKQIVAHLHHEPDWVHVRPPFTLLAEAQTTALIAGMASLQPLLAPIAA